MFPTFKELGMEFYPRIARGAMAPKAVPKDILKRLGEGLSGDDFKTRI